MLGAPFRAGAAHVVHFWPVAVAYVQDQVANDAGEVRDRLRRLTRKPNNAFASMILIGELLLPPDTLAVTGLNRMCLCSNICA